MTNQFPNFDQRGQPRINVEFPATISVGSQLTVKGYLKDLSLSAAFIRIKNNIYLSINDEIGIAIQCSPTDPSIIIEGTARISRIVPGEGFAVYFTKLDDSSQKLVKRFIQKTEVQFGG